MAEMMDVEFDIDGQTFTVRIPVAHEGELDPFNAPPSRKTGKNVGDMLGNFDEDPRAQTPPHESAPSQEQGGQGQPQNGQDNPSDQGGFDINFDFSPDEADEDPEPKNDGTYGGDTGDIGTDTGESRYDFYQDEGYEGSHNNDGVTGAPSDNYDNHISVQMGGADTPTSNAWVIDLDDGPESSASTTADEEDEPSQTDNGDEASGGFSIEVPTFDFGNVPDEGEDVADDEMGDPERTAILNEIQNQPIAPDSAVSVTKGKNKADIDITAIDPDKLIELDGISHEDVLAIQEATDALGVQSQSLSGIPPVTPPSLILTGQGVSPPSEAPIVDSETGMIDDSPPEIAPDEEDPDSEEAQERNKQRTKALIQSVGIVVAGLVIMGGIATVFVLHGSSSSSTTSTSHTATAKKSSAKKSSAKKSSAKTTSPPTTATTTPATTTGPYTSAEFAKFCQAARSYPSITLSTSVAPTTIANEFQAAKTAIGGMETYADSATKPLILQIGSEDAQISSLLVPYSWSISKVPSSQYATLQSEAQALNGFIARLNQETAKCSS